MTMLMLRFILVPFFIIYDLESSNAINGENTNTEFKVEFLEIGLYFPDDTQERDIYQITLKRGDRVYKFKFGQSINGSCLRLYLDKNKTKRTRHAGFKIPEEVRKKYP